MDKPIRRAVERLLPDAQKFLCKLITFPSTPGLEHKAMLCAEKAFARAGAEVERVMLSDEIRKDPDYSDPIPDIKYEDRFNIRALRKGSGGGRNLILNAHMDVVPPSENMIDPWTPRVDNGVVYGRGAADDKGQVACAYLVLRTLKALNVRLKGDLISHIVVEEENGGNGTLAMARRGEKADGAIVIEATEGRVFTSIRGAVWFNLTLRGKAGHSGQAGSTRSALLLARDAIAALEKYHAELLAASRGFPLFDVYPNPMPITFGKLHAGDWPAMAPSKAALEGVLGLLPNKTKEQVMDEMRRVLAGCPGFAENFDLHFMYRHDASVVDLGHELPKALLAAAASAGEAAKVDAMTASCDAWFYNNQLKIPTVVYGPGTLKVAHSKDEQIAMAEIASAAEVLARFAMDYCGVE